MFSLFALVHAHGPALAQDAMVWSFSEGNDPNNKGRMTARLGLGTPETDNSRVSGTCEARSGSGVNAASLILSADVGKLPENSSVNVRFTGGGFNHFVQGTIQGTQVEEGITGVDLTVKIDDPLWKALTEQDSLDYLVPGYRASTLELKAGHDKIRKFIEACRAYAKALKPEKTAQASSSAGAGVTQKEAFEAAKELGTIEAWEAFLNNFPTGFRADLARAYVKQLGSEGPRTAQKPKPDVTASKPPAPSAAPVPPGPADLSLAVTANQKNCAGSAPCSYTVVAKNTGGQPFSGQLVIANSLSPRGARLTGSGPAPWTCRGMGGGAVCTNAAANIAPGQSTTISLTFTLPRIAGGTVDSCASVSWGGAPTASSVRDVQRKLNALGYKVGRPDGKAGRRTINAIRQFQQTAGLQATGEIDLPLLIAMFTQEGKGDANPANDQACAGSAVVSVSAPAPVKAWKPPRGYKRAPYPAATGRCSSRSVWLEGQCILKTHVASFCGPGFHRRGSRCVSNASAPAGRDGHLLNTLPACSDGKVRIKGRCCAPGSGVENGGCTYRTKNRKTACKPGFTRHENWCMEKPFAAKTQGSRALQPQKANVPQQQRQQPQQQFQQQVTCSRGRIANANGQCECPAHLPRWSKGECKSEKAHQTIQKQLTQPQQQPQQQQQQPQQQPEQQQPYQQPRQAPPPRTRQQQQQDQIQQGINNLLNQFSDARLKRDVRYLGTREDGIRLYSFRYLWGDEVRVGVMAQDLLDDPARRTAVSVHASGYYVVDYGKLGLDPATLNR